jgi:hypothetical protein
MSLDHHVTWGGGRKLDYLNTLTVRIECTIDCAFHLFATFGIYAFDGLVVTQHMSNIFFEVSPKERLKLN